MGEAKQKRERIGAAGFEHLVTEITKKLTDEGLLIAAGWEGFRRSAVPADAAQIQIDEMRLAFFAGADHLFVAMLKFLEEGEEPTAKDLKRMDLIHDELERFRNNELLKRMPTKGQG